MKLFDLYLQAGDINAFQMRAPLPVIVQVIKLGDKAMARIEEETKDGHFCDLHNNGFTWYARRAYHDTDPIEAQVKLYGVPLEARRDDNHSKHF